MSFVLTNSKYVLLSVIVPAYVLSRYKKIVCVNAGVIMSCR